MSIIKKKNEGRAVHPVIKKLRGTYRKDRDGIKMDLEPMQEIPICPAHYDDETKDIWYSIVGSLHKVKLLQSVGIPQIKIFCDQYMIYKENIEDVRKNGSRLTVRSKNGNVVVKRNPALDVIQSTYSIIGQISDRFGFNPLAQSRIKNVGNGGDGKEKEEGDGFNF